MMTFEGHFEHNKNDNNQTFLESFPINRTKNKIIYKELVRVVPSDVCTYLFEVHAVIFFKKLVRNFFSLFQSKNHNILKHAYKHKEKKEEY